VTKNTCPPFNFLPVDAPSHTTLFRNDITNFTIVLKH